MEAKEIKQNLQTSFKLRGLQLRLEACRHLTELLLPVPEHDREELIERILTNVEKQKLKSAVIDRDILEIAISETTSNVAGEENPDHVLNVISAFEVPRVSYCTERRKFLPDSMLGIPEPDLLPGAQSKNNIFHQRYRMLLQRTSRHDLFSSSSAVPALRTEDAKAKYQLKPVEFLLGTTTRLDNVIVLGMIAQITYGSYHLEDPSGAVRLDLTDVKFHTGIYTENCFVLAEGWYEDGVFHALALGFSPPETHETTMAYFGNINFFGGPFETTVKANETLIKLEKSNNAAMFVFVSDVWLDDPAVMDRLQRLFFGYSFRPPTAFVFFGNFLAAPAGNCAYGQSLKEHFKQLGELIAKYPSLVEQSEFMFVPGPSDPGSPNILPRPPLPKFIRSDLEKLVPRSSFLTNPARVQYCSQQIVLFREDILTKMCRNAIYLPQDDDVGTHFAKTITSQGHLAPLPVYNCPIYWDYDRSLYLYPLPDLIVTADKFEPFSAENLNCKVINPGTFAKYDFSFKTYIPSTRTIEDSQVPGNED